MTNTDAQFNSWSDKNPYDTGWPVGSTTKTSWSQKCVSFVHRAGNFGATAGTASLVYRDTKAKHKIYTTDELPLNSIPKGWLVYFSLASTPDGHIGKSTGNGNFLSATAWVPGTIKRGILGIAAYEKAAGAKCLGASPYFLDQHLSGVNTSIPVAPVIKPAAESITSILGITSTKEDEMYIIVPKTGARKGKATLVTPYTFDASHGLSSEEVSSLRKVGVPYKKVTAADFTNIENAVKSSQALFVALK